MGNDILPRVSGAASRNPAPVELFHYTSAGGLLEIIQSNRVWATNLEFMNDFLEIKYAKQLFLDRVHKASRSSRLRPVRRFLDHAARTFFPLTNNVSFYAISFCADGGDRLSQWRAYAHEGTGYSIGFRTSELLRTIRLYRSIQPDERLELIQVIYKPADQEALVEKAIRKICRRVERVWSGGRKAPGRRSTPGMPDFLCADLLPYLFSFKAEGFQEENEWRLVTWIPSRLEPDRISFRASANFTIPYLSLDIGGRDGATGPKLPISKIIQGPRVEAEAGMKSLQLLLRKYSYRGVKISASEIPLRYVS